MNPQRSVTKHHNLIYDVGMHKGEDTEYYLKKGFRVIGFEADPELVEHCKIRFAGAIAHDRLVIIQGAIIQNDSIESPRSKITFYRNLNNSDWGTTHSTWASRNERLGTRIEAINVDAVHFVECINKYGIPYYMKTDIEGCDTVCLKSLLQFEQKPDYVSIESEKVSFDRLVAEFELLEQLGYRRFVAVPQAKVHLQVPPNPAKEGRYVSHIFQPGSSGLFGRELPEKWQTKEAVLRKYRRIFLGYKLLGDESFIKQNELGRKLVRGLSRKLQRGIPGWYDTHAQHLAVGL